MAYLDNFMEDPLAKSLVEKKSLPQMARTAADPPPLEAQESVTDMAGNMMKEKLLTQGATEIMGGMGLTPFDALPVGETVPAALGEGAILGETGALASATTPAVAAAAPWLIGGYLVGNALGLFSHGGHVGPLYASKGRKSVEGKSIKEQLYPLLMEEYLKEQDKIKDEIEQSRYIASGTRGPVAERMQRGTTPEMPISKIKYKYGGGKVNEEIEVSFSGPLSK